jgi:isocitrate/isopropylmalate dehydrogenase
LGRFAPYFRTRLLAILDALQVERTAHDVVTHAWQVLDAAAAHQHDAVFLQVVAFTADVRDDSNPLVKRTLATLRSAEFGFFGVVVYTRVQTPRRCGEFCIAGDLLLVAST